MKGSMSVGYCGVEFDIEFDYYPEEPMVRYYTDGSGYPGSPASLEINKISIGGVDVSELCDECNITEKLEEKMWEVRD